MSLSKFWAKDVDTPMRAAFPKPSFNIQFTAALVAKVLLAPIPSEYNSDWVANIMFTCEKYLCTQKPCFQFAKWCSLGLEARQLDGTHMAQSKLPPLPVVWCHLILFWEEG